MRKISLVTLAVVSVFAGAACGSVNSEPSDERPSAPKKVAEKKIDPPHYKTERTCTARYTTGTNKGKGKCKSYTSKSKQTDDKDWILITADGTSYDVDESEYNSVNVGDYWPR